MITTVGVITGKPTKRGLGTPDRGETTGTLKTPERVIDQERISRHSGAIHVTTTVTMKILDTDLGIVPERTTA